MKRTLLCILAALLVFSVSSCGGGVSETEPVIQEDTVMTETEPAETTRADIKDGLAEDLDLQGQTVSFIVVPECAPYDIIGESGGDIVFDAVYTRNLNVEERLNVDLECIQYGVGNEHDALAQEISNAVMAASNEFSGVMQRGQQAYSLSLQGMYMNLKDNAYVDLTRPWWNDSIADISINTDKVYVLMGDITLSPFLFSTSCYFNKAMMEDYSLDVNKLYETVQNGDWTYDVLKEYCSVVYKDVDGDGQASDSDQYGFTWTTNASYFTRSAGLKYISRDEDGYPVLALNNEKSIGLLEQLTSILHDSTYSYYLPNQSATKISPYFINGKNLFFMGRLAWVTTIYTDNLRNMEDPYGIIPFPKYAVDDEYMAGTGASSGNLVAVPIICPNFDETCIVVEAMCAESYRIVFPAMYETALKTKYSDTSIDSQMIDLIHDSVYNDFTIVARVDILLDSLVQENKSDFASVYASNETKILDSLTKMIESYKSIE